MTIKIDGYDPVGPRTYGAEHARRSDELPDEVKPHVGEKHQVGSYKYTIGDTYNVLGVSMICVGANPGMRLALDARATTPEVLDQLLPEGRLFLWRGAYWWVKAVRGVNVVLTYWGAKKRRDGWRTFVKGGREFAVRKTKPS